MTPWAPWATLGRPGQSTAQPCPPSHTGPNDQKRRNNVGPGPQMCPRAHLGSPCSHVATAVLNANRICRVLLRLGLNTRRHPRKPGHPACRGAHSRIRGAHRPGTEPGGSPPQGPPQGREENHRSAPRPSGAEPGPDPQQPQRIETHRNDRQTQGTGSCKHGTRRRDQKSSR